MSEQERYAIQNARVRDRRYLLVRRTLTPQREGRVQAHFPKWLLGTLGYDGGATAEGRDGWSEVLVRPEAPPPGENAGLMVWGDVGRAGDSAGIRLMKDVAFRVPFREGDDVVLDMDLTRPENGILMREPESWEPEGFGNVSPMTIDGILDGD